MATHRTVLLIADSCKSNDYEYQLQQDDHCSYEILTQQYDTQNFSLPPNQQIDGILLELQPSYANSVDILQKLQEQMGAQCPPIIVIAGGEAEMAACAFKNGAADYLVKERMTPADLRLTLRSAIENADVRRKLPCRGEHLLALDLSQQKQAEAAIHLKRSELLVQQSERQVQRQLAEIEAIYQSAPIGLNVLDTDLRFVRINQRLADINGLPAEAHIGRTVRELFPDLADTVERLLKPVIETGEPLMNVEIHGEIPAQPGVKRTWLEHFLPLKDGDRVVGISTVCEEITERIQIEAALRQSEERYRYLAETIPQLVWTCDASGLCDYVNQRLCTYIGLTFDQAVGEGWLSAVHPDDRPVSQSKWMTAARQGIQYRHEYRFRRASDGSYRWHLVLGLPLKDAQDQVVKWFGTCTDIHDQKELEIERDRLLQQEQAAREAAERANRIKDEFLAVLSHELRSPLNPILGWTKLLQMRKLDETKTAEALAIIERNARVQTQLIDDLLDVAKILRGKLSLTMAPVNPATVIEAAIDTVKTAAIAKLITLHAIAPNIGQLSGDTARLQQIIWNLLSNAIKFTPTSGRVEVRLEQVDGGDGGDYAQITVTDTGKGINPDFLPHIFESFRQEDASITRKYGGLGLGLAIVRQLVEAHGGTIRASSPGEGLGTTFTVRLPLLNDEPEADPPDQMFQPDLNLKGIRILAVDDDPDARDLLTVLLTQYGAEVLMVASAAEVLTHLDTFQPHVFVSDIGMPDVDGYALIQQIRMLPPERGGQIPAIALTAYARSDDHERSRLSGYQRHVTKPLEPEQLVEAVIALTQGKTLM